jgi:hypothetical protein
MKGPIYFAFTIFIRHSKDQIDELLPDKWVLALRSAPMGNISAEATHME